MVEPPVKKGSIGTIYVLKSDSPFDETHKFEFHSGDSFPVLFLSAPGHHQPKIQFP